MKGACFLTKPINSIAQYGQIVLVKNETNLNYQLIKDVQDLEPSSSVTSNCTFSRALNL